MTTQRITPLAGCRICGGKGKTKQRHLPGYVETITCECVLDQITDDDADIIIEEDDSWADAAYDSWKERDFGVPPAKT